MKFKVGQWVTINNPGELHHGLTVKLHQTSSKDVPGRPYVFRVGDKWFCTSEDCLEEADNVIHVDFENRRRVG